MEDPADEIRRLQRCINDLVSILALPAIWSGGDSAQIVDTLLDALLGMLRLDMVYLRVQEPVGALPTDTIRLAPDLATPARMVEIRELLGRRLEEGAGRWLGETRERVSGIDLVLLPVQLSLQQNIGFLVAGSQRPGFPEQTERLLLGVAANEASIGIQEARLLGEQRRLADELDRRVAERTLELAAANAELQLRAGLLQESELNLRQLTETIPEMLWSATPEGAIDYCNSRLLEYTGVPAGAVMGSGWTQLLHPDDVVPTTQAWQASVTTGAPFQVEVRAFHAADRSYHWCVVSARSLPATDGRILKWHGTVVDMHDWKQAQDELRQLQAELAHLTRVMTMGELTASIAHEVNQPLAGIITNASTCLRMLAADPPNIEGARETARRTIRDGNRASEVVVRLRALFSRKPVVAEMLDLNEAAGDVIALLAGELERGRVTVRAELAGELPRVMGDRIQLQQVILNLVMNAVEAMSAAGGGPKHLVIRTEGAEEDRVSLAVEDTGPGLGPGVVDRLFEAFYTTKSGGMGIGLAVCRSIVESHHGRLWAHGNDGPGATFAFSIPRASPGSPAELAPVHRATAVPAAGTGRLAG